ncbi:MAG: integration host factor subunit beta [Thiomonas sp.]|nr:integration host factor subunit beta [Thiomonas sp.]
MTRSDLVELLASQFPQLAHRDAELSVKTILDALAQSLDDGHRVEIRGFGSFSVSHRPARIGRNPRSGEQVAVPEKRIPHFKPGKTLRELADYKAGDEKSAVSAKAQSAVD